MPESPRAVLAAARRRFLGNGGFFRRVGVFVLKVRLFAGLRLRAQGLRIAILRLGGLFMLLRFLAPGLGEFGSALLFLFKLEELFPVLDRNLVIIGVDFVERQKTVAIAAIFDKGRLQGGLHAGHLGQIDIATQLFLAA